MSTFEVCVVSVAEDTGAFLCKTIEFSGRKRNQYRQAARQSHSDQYCSKDDSGSAVLLIESPSLLQSPDMVLSKAVRSSVEMQLLYFRGHHTLFFVCTCFHELQEVACSVTSTVWRRVQVRSTLQPPGADTPASAKVI